MSVSTETMMAMLRQPRDMDTPGGRLWRARGALNLTIEDLGRRLDVPAEMVSDWERDRSEPDGDHLTTLSGVLGVTPGWLITGIADPAGLTPSTLRALLDALDTLKARQAETGQALQALEISLRRVLQDI